MLLPRPILGLLCIAASAAFACVATPTGRQDVGLLAGSGASDWRAFLTASPESALATLPDDGIDALSFGAFRPAPTLGTRFVLARLEVDATMPVPRAKPRPFVDRAARADRLPLPDPDREPVSFSSAVTPMGVTGMGARAARTPDDLMLVSATPYAADGPISVAAMPVQEPETRPTFRLASLPNEDTAEGITSAERGSRRMGTSTRLSHLMLLPENDLAAQQKCLAEAVYFEARGEPERGQYAVAQVVMNRTRSGFYPNTACKVVYQNKHRFNACQFSFACDRFPDRIYSRAAWVKAQRIAKDVTESGAWLPEVGGATHYHADYVRPYWAPKMIKLRTIGRHIFYRPHWLPDLGAEPAVSQIPRRPLSQDS